MGELTQKCVKVLMFIFNFLFFIIGIALIAAGGVFQAKYTSLSHFFDQGVTAPVLLIIVGVFISIISFLGCCGAARENYYMLMGFGVLMTIIFIMQVAGGIAALVQKEKIPGLISKGISDDVGAYYNNGSKTQKDNVDSIQITLSCCGSNGFDDWKYTVVPNITAYRIPPSCCITAKCDTSKDIDKCYSPDAEAKKACPVYTRGCADVAGKLLQLAMLGAGGVALGFAVIELIGLVFAFYLARRIRKGYTYA